MFLLIYDKNCRFCTKLAFFIKKISNDFIKIVPHSCKKIKRILYLYYGEDPEFNFYLIEHNDAGIKVYKGLGIIPYIIKLLGRNTLFKLPYYVLLLRRNLSSTCLRCRNDLINEILPARRRFFKLFLLGVSILIFKQLPIPATALIRNDNYVTSSIRNNWKTKVIWRNRRELTDNEKKKVIREILENKDIKNVIRTIGYNGYHDGFKVVEHEVLYNGNRVKILATSFTYTIQDNNRDEKYVVVHYKLSQPIENYISESFSLKYTNDVIEINTISVNGKVVANLTANEHINSTGCVGCVDPFFGPWVDYECQNCTNLDWLCVFGCCNACSWCSFLPPPSSIACALACIAAWCPICTALCCTQWEPACCGCPESGVP